MEWTRVWILTDLGPQLIGSWHRFLSDREVRYVCHGGREYAELMAMPKPEADK